MGATPNTPLLEGPPPNQLANAITIRRSPSATLSYADSEIVPVMPYGYTPSMIPPTPAVDTSGIAICHTPSRHLPRGPRSGTIHLEDSDTPDFVARMKELYLTANDSISFSAMMDVINNIHYDLFHVPDTVINDNGNSVFSPSDAAPLFHNIGVAINSLIQESAMAKNCESFLIAQVHNLSHLLEKVATSQHTVDKGVALSIDRTDNLHAHLDANLNSLAEHLDSKLNHISTQITSVRDVKDTTSDDILQLSIDMAEQSRTTQLNINALNEKITLLERQTDSHLKDFRDFALRCDGVVSCEEGDVMNMDNATAEFPCSQAPSPPSTTPHSLFPSKQELISVLKETINASMVSSLDAVVSSAILPTKETLSSIS